MTLQKELFECNELIGEYRELGEFAKGEEVCKRILEICEALNNYESADYATSLLNMATFYRAKGDLKTSMRMYRDALEVFDRTIEPENILFAGLYNNMSMLFQEMGDFDSAIDCQEKALSIAKLHEDSYIEVAVTLTNLATTKMKLEQFEEAREHLLEAVSLFQKDEKPDYHYSGALSALGELYYLLGKMQDSERYYKEALAEIERTAGRNLAYEITKQNLHVVETQRLQFPDLVEEMKGLDLCEAFYNEFGKPMIATRFSNYVNQIAVGLVGEGSECFGFDDEISRDHDFGPGFCMFLTDEIYDQIGEELQKEYDKLPKTYKGITRVVSDKAPKRVGVLKIGDFYNRLIALEDVPVSNNQWLFLEDYQLATATNGRVFVDDCGEFTRIRKGLLSYYPEEVRIRKIARTAALMAQTGQYNYRRMLQRGDTVTAVIALGDFVNQCLSMLYLLNRRYAPFYKWMHRGAKNLPIANGVVVLLEKLSLLTVGDSHIPEIIEEIVALIILEMKKQGLTHGEDNYLDHHTDNIIKAIPMKNREDIKEEYIKTIVLLEWEAFDRVQNEGGRAYCQDDFFTFNIMRRSQYMTWNMEMLECYISDFRRANQEGRNLITEKYGRMMESTAPKKYAEIKGAFPTTSSEKMTIINEIVKIQVSWMEEFAKKYPNAAYEARSIHTSEDTPYNTSYETYLRGELQTYSDDLLDLYGRFIASLWHEKKNLAQMTMENSARLYGYESLEVLENKLSKLS